MKKKRLECKEYYTEEELLNHKIRNVGESLIRSLCKIMMERAGYDYEWCIRHDKEDMHIIDLCYFKDKESYEDFKEIAIKIISKQLECSRSNAEKEYGWFHLFNGINYIDNNIEKRMELLRNKIKFYEKIHGELLYEDGWEKDLKVLCGYNK